MGARKDPARQLIRNRVGASIQVSLRLLLFSAQDVTLDPVPRETGLLDCLEVGEGDNGKSNQLSVLYARTHF
jgi:hypothetical protein